MSTGAWRCPSVSTPNTATWQLSTLPSRPDHCRATPTERSPCLAKLLSSMINVPAGLPPNSRSASWLICASTGSWPHWLVVRWRVADEMPELPGAALVNHGCHRRKTAIRRLCRSAPIASSHRRTVACLGAEEAARAIDEDGECVCNPIDQRSGSRSSIRTYGYVTNGLCQFASPIARFVGNLSIRPRSCTSSPNFRALSPECDFVKLHPRRDLPRPRHRRGHHHARRQYRMHQSAPGRDQHSHCP